MLQNCVPVHATVFRASVSACMLRPTAAASVAAASQNPRGMSTIAMPCSCVVRSSPLPQRFARTASASSCRQPRRPSGTARPIVQRSGRRWGNQPMRSSFRAAGAGGGRSGQGRSATRSATYACTPSMPMRSTRYRRRAWWRFSREPWARNRSSTAAVTATTWSGRTSTGRCHAKRGFCPCVPATRTWNSTSRPTRRARKLRSWVQKWTECSAAPLRQMLNLRGRSEYSRLSTKSAVTSRQSWRVSISSSGSTPLNGCAKTLRTLS